MSRRANPPINQLKVLRCKLNMTQQDVADATGVNLRLIQKYENGECSISNMRIDFALRYARVLGIPVDELIGGNNRGNPAE